MDDYSDEHIERITTLQSIIKRPLMYTPNGSIHEVLLVIHGYQLFISFQDERFKEIKAFNEWMDLAITIDEPDWNYEVTQRPDALLIAFGSEQAFFQAASDFLAQLHSDTKPTP